MTTPPDIESGNISRYHWSIRHPFIDGQKDSVALIVTPHTGLLPRWRFVLPHDYKNVVKWGVGDKSGGEVNTAPRGKVASEGAVTIQNGPTVVWFGALEPLSATQAAYLVFQGDAPHYVMFGQAPEVDAPPDKLEGVSFGEHDHHASFNMSEPH